MTRSDRLSVTTNTAFFSHRSFTKMKSIMQTANVAANDLIFLEGDPMDKLFIVLKGKVVLSKLNEEGKVLVFHYFFTNDLFGEFNPLQKHESAFTARAVEDSVIGVFHQDDFETLIRENGEVGLNFTQWQSHMRRFTQYKLRDLTFHGKNGALAATLLRAANTFGVLNHGRLTITKKFTNSELAELVGTSRETVNRLLSSFKKKEMITYTDGNIEVLDVKGLKDLCRCEECPTAICRL
ncbi:Crp/Fnr family transcriptional regulator [Salicibibacter halophilus]|uniref:Crp/Fnr family transcriptional regulator n=1 Tax=Salicibibacter halophilus TaxID=2502791 RepID=A0A514LJW6_9BACI|nr:Crp/Fnr family transcriptional regulator [Salicibibacter halophilus]QDI92149.1 Crp/Fnr family transcriptional regulator [Salicibibacter halophilus]